MFAQGLGPAEHQWVAQADFATDMQHVAVAIRQRQIAPRGFPGLQQLVGIHHKRLAIGGQARAGAVAYKQGTAQLAFQVFHAGGDGGLGDVQFLGGGGEAAAAGDFEEGACQFDVHEAPRDEWGTIVVECDQELWEGACSRLQCVS